jgi:hypothetical protein
MSPPARSWPKTAGLKLSKRRVEILGVDTARVAACPDQPMLPPCSGPSRRGLETPENAAPAECQPALTAPARDGVRNLRSGRKKACGRGRTKERDQEQGSERAARCLWRRSGKRKNARHAGQVHGGQWFCEVRSETVVAIEGFRKTALRRTGNCRTDRVGRHHVRA